MNAASVLAAGSGPRNTVGTTPTALRAGSAVLQAVGGTNQAPSARTQSVLDDSISKLSGLVRSNNLASAEAASALNKWQEVQNDKAMQFSASEAAKNRDWQKMMSDTAHQREVRDLQAAGLNPVLSAMGGNGAAVGSGATASGVTSSGSKSDTDMSTSKGMVELMSSLLANETQLASTAMSAKSNEAVAEKYNAMSWLVQVLTGQQKLSQISLENELGGQRDYNKDVWANYRAGLSSAASRYAADTQYAIHRDFPNTGIAALASVLGSLFGDGKGLGSVADGVVGAGKEFGDALGKVLSGEKLTEKNDYYNTHGWRSKK